MISRITKLVGGLVGAALCVSMVTTAARPVSVAAGTNLSLPSYAQLVENSAAQTWDQKPGSRMSGEVSVIVHMNMTPMAMVSRNWTHEQRRAYVQQIQVEQDKLVPQIEGLGGEVLGRFTHVSTGLAVNIDASKVKDLRAIANVIGVHGVTDYALDLTETVPWIGATDLQEMGVTGKHRPDLGGRNIDVAVINSGIDYTHVKLGGSGSLSDYNSCYATNTTVGDCVFFPNAKVKGGYDWVGENWPTFSASIEPDPDPIDAEGHGTHVADIIGGFEFLSRRRRPGCRAWREHLVFQSL